MKYAECVLKIVEMQETDNIKTSVGRRILLQWKIPSWLHDLMGISSYLVLWILLWIKAFCFHKWNQILANRRLWCLLVLLCCLLFFFGGVCVLGWVGRLGLYYVGKMFWFYHVDMLLHAARPKLNFVILKIIGCCDLYINCTALLGFLHCLC